MKNHNHPTLSHELGTRRLKIKIMAYDVHALESSLSYIIYIYIYVQLATRVCARAPSRKIARRHARAHAAWPLITPSRGVTHPEALPTVARRSLFFASTREMIICDTPVWLLSRLITDIPTPVICQFYFFRDVPSFNSYNCFGFNGLWNFDFRLLSFFFFCLAI